MDAAGRKNQKSCETSFYTIKHQGCVNRLYYVRALAPLRASVFFGFSSFLLRVFENDLTNTLVIEIFFKVFSYENLYIIMLNMNLFS